MDATSRAIFPTLLLVIAGCGRGIEATETNVREARSVWKKAGVSNYDLEWKSEGLRNATYRVFVRGGDVRAVYMVLENGNEIVSKSAEPKMFGVEGLFTIIEDELFQLETSTPFGRPKGASLALRFTPDPTYGFPRRYVRDVSGTFGGIEITVIKFNPAPPSTVRPPNVSG